MSAKSLVTGVIVGAVLGGGAAWAVLSPRAADLETQVGDLEIELQDARHDAGEMKAVAEAEHLRTESARRQLEDLRSVRNAKSPEAMAHRQANGTTKKPGPPPPPPLPENADDWTREHVATAVAALARRPRFQRPNHPQFKKVLRGLEAQDDTLAVVAALLTDEDPAVRGLTANLMGAAGREEAVEPLTQALAGEKDLKARRGLLSALGKLPGDGQTAVLLEVLEDRSKNADQTSRQIAASALARRAHPAALKVVSGEIEEPPQVRVRAVEGLYSRVRDSGFEDDAHVAVFCTVLGNADGDVQRGYALAAVEGLWTKDCIEAAKAVAANEEVAEKLRARAQRLVDGLESGATRPEGAGEFDRKSMSGKKRRVRRPGPGAPMPPTETPKGTKSPEKSPEKPADGTGPK